MAFSFIPKEEKFFELFDHQAAHNVEAAKVFKELVASWNPKSDAFKKLQDIEHEGDITAHEIYDKLNRTFITPFDREDIHLLASELDDIVDILQSVATRMQLYHIDAMKPEIAPMADILLSAAESVRKAIGEMKDPQKIRRVQDYCIEINRLENAGDRALEAAIGKLFEGKPDPLEVIKWKEIYEGLEASIDKCEDVAHMIESILVKNA
jgi:predicted phosphate transport protein (TIGR00153 family)